MGEMYLISMLFCSQCASTVWIYVANSVVLVAVMFYPQVAPLVQYEMSGIDVKRNVRHSILLRHSKESHTGVIPIPMVSSVTEKKRLDSRSVRGYFLGIVPTVSTHVVSI